MPVDLAAATAQGQVSDASAQDYRFARPGVAKLTSALETFQASAQLSSELCYGHVFDHADEVDRTIAFGCAISTPSAIPSATIVGDVGTRVPRPSSGEDLFRVAPGRGGDLDGDRRDASARV